jgi:hypothetical protein
VLLDDLMWLTDISCLKVPGISQRALTDSRISNFGHNLVTFYAILLLIAIRPYIMSPFKGATIIYLYKIVLIMFLERGMEFKSTVKFYAILLLIAINSYIASPFEGATIIILRTSSVCSCVAQKIKCKPTYILPFKTKFL